MDHRGPYSPIFARVSYHVEHYPCLSGLVKVQPVPADKIVKHVRCENPVRFRFDVVTGDIVFLLPVHRVVDALLRVVVSIGKVLQNEKRGGGAALAQVDLDSVRLPRTIFLLRNDKVKCIAPDNAFTCQTLPDLFRLFDNQCGLYAGSAGKVAPM